MSKLDKLKELSPEQITRLSELQKKWQATAQGTGRGVHQAAEEAMQRAYEAAGLEFPSQVLWLRSPLEGAVAAALITHSRTSKSLKKELHLKIEKKCWQLGKARLSSKVFDQIWHEVVNKIGPRHNLEVSRAVSIEVAPSALLAIRAKVVEDIHSQLESIGNLGSELQQADELMEAVLNQVLCKELGPAKEGLYICGSSDVSSFAAADAFIEFGIDDFEPLRGMMQAAENTGWWWPFKDLVVATERPVALNYRYGNDGYTSGRFHSDSDMAIKYADGFGLWRINGQRVSEQTVLRPETLTLKEIDSEEDQRVREIMRHRYGYERYLREHGATLTDDDSKWGRLWHLQRPTDDEQVALVEVTNPASADTGGNKSYFLRVPPEIKTAHAAVAWTFTDQNGNALTPESYLPTVET